MEAPGGTCPDLSEETCPGYNNTAVGSAAYTITSLRAARPTFSPAAGVYGGSQSVTISTSTPGCSAFLFWNTTGNPTSGDTQGTSVSVASSETVYAKVICCPGYSNSYVGSAAYAITSLSQAATPAFSPAAGTYTGTQSVTVSTSTPGCSGSLYWNTTGNPTSSDTQGTSVNVTSSETVYAKVICCPGYSDSAVGSAAYTMTSTGPGLPTLVQDSAWGTNDGTETGNGFIYHLPNPTLANNLLICGVSWDTAATATITDNIGTNTWVSDPTSNNGTRRVALRYVLGVAAGTQDLTLTLSASAANVHFRCSEFCNVATSSAVDGTATSASNVTGPAVASGSITTTVNGDLIYHYGIDDGA